MKHVMLKDTVDGEFTTTADAAAAVLFCAGFETNALTGQSLVVSHGCYMEQAQRTATNLAWTARLGPSAQRRKSNDFAGRR